MFRVPGFIDARILGNLLITRVRLPRTQTSLFDVRAKEGGKETTGETCKLSK